MTLLKSRFFLFLVTAMAVFCSTFLHAGEISLTWTMPTNTVDGIPLTDLAGAKVYYGVASSNYTAVIDVGNTNACTITGLEEGVTYYLNGTAYNTSGLESDFCNEAVKIAAPSSGNEPPHVNAGADLATTLPNPVSLDASVTDDGLPQGSTLTVTWSKVQGAGTVTFANEDAIDTSATFSISGSYTLRLQAFDGEYTVADEVSVTVSSGPVPRAPFNLRTIQ